MVILPCYTKFQKVAIPGFPVDFGVVYSRFAISVYLSLSLTGWSSCLLAGGSSTNTLSVVVVAVSWRFGLLFAAGDFASAVAAMISAASAATSAAYSATSAGTVSTGSTTSRLSGYPSAQLT